MLRVTGQGWNITFNWAKVIDKSIFTRNSKFNVLAHAARSDSNNLCICLTETWSQQWSTLNKDPKKYKSLGR